MENSNKCKLIPSLAAIAFCFGVSSTASAAIFLDDYGFNVDGNVAYPFDGDDIPSGIDISLFDDFITGLGTINVTITGAGTHYFGAVFDHEISEPGNSFFNETGFTSVTAAAFGQSWEIDEPGFVDGDIYDNFEAGALDDQIGVSIYGDTTFPDDVSMAMGWDFSLANGESALILLTLGTIQPTGFFLEQYDPDSDTSIFLSSTLEISPIPVPAAIWLFGSGLLGLIGFGRRNAKA